LQSGAQLISLPGDEPLFEAGEANSDLRRGRSYAVITLCTICFTFNSTQLNSSLLKHGSRTAKRDTGKIRIEIQRLCLPKTIVQSTVPRNPTVSPH